MRTIFVRVTISLVLVLSAIPLMAEETLAEFDARLERELGAIDAAALETWKAANAARAAGDNKKAAGLYAEVYRKVPSFVHALRRQGVEELALGRIDEAVKHLREAVARDRSKENLLAFEMANLNVAANQGSWDEAKAALDRARAYGLDPAAYTEIAAQLEAAIPFYVRWRKPALVSLAVWFGGFALLLLAGAILSRMALKAARKPPTTTSGNATGLSSSVQKTYSTVLFLSCVFYYASIPIVILMVLGLGGGLLWAIFALGRVPVKLVVVIVVLVGVTLWSMIKSFFVKTSDEDPGVRLDMAKELRLRTLLNEVAKRIGTKPVDNVYVTPGTEVAVMERGKRSRKERCLILGVAALEGLAVRPLKAILGHEYGHFTNRDTAGGTFALSVRKSLGATAYGLATGGAAAWYNPAWLFVNGFNRVFLRISEGASRLQELLADRWAAFAYGADAFEHGLRHVVAQSVRFDAHVGATLREVVDRKLPLSNLYTYVPAEKDEDLAKAIDESLNRKASPYDSHPAPADRFALVRALPVRSRRIEPDDDAPAWSLFSNPTSLQQMMTAEIRANVAANYGVAIEAE